MRRKVKTPLVVSVSFVAAAAIGIAAFLDMAAKTRPKSELAVISFLSGIVEYRNDGAATWQVSVIDQHLFPGDRVATSEGGLAMLSLTTGQTIELGSDSQVEIAGRQSRESGVEITVVRGLAKITGAVGSVVSAKFSGGDWKRISRGGEKICISAQEGGSTARECSSSEQEDVIEGRPIGTKDGAIVGSKRTREGSAISDDSDRKEKSALDDLPGAHRAPSSVSANLLAKGLEASIVGQGGDVQAWAIGSLQNGSLAFNVKIQPPAGKSVVAQWSPLLEILNNRGEGRGSTIVGSVKWSAQDIPIPMKTIRLVGTQEAELGIQGIGFQVRSGGGIPARQGRALDSSFSRATTSYHIRSFKDLPSGPIEIGLQAVRKSIVQKDWIFRNRSFDSGRAKITIRLNTSSDALRIVPFLGDGEFYLGTTVSPVAGEVFVIRRMEVVAGVTGRIDAKAAAELRAVLDGDFVFRGSRTAFFDSRRKTSDDLKRWVDSLSSTGGQVFLMKENQLVPISKSFLQMKGQVLQFVGNNAPYIFSQKVNILDVRPGL